MTVKTVLSGLEPRKALLQGALTAAKAVGITYGPHGRTAMLDRPMGLISTRDGVTVAREVELEDPNENLGAKILTEACVRVNDEVGDGTTTTAILAAAILNEGHKLVIAGYDPNQLALGMQAAASEAVRTIESLAIEVSTQAELQTVALLASNRDEEIAKHLAEACMAVGKDGTVLIEDGHGLESTLELKEGMEIDRGALSPHFLSGEKLERVMEGPLVAVINRSLRTVEDVRELLEVSTQWPRELLVIAQSVEGEALATMVMNDQKGVKNSCAILPPGFGPYKADWLQDIAALSGATFVDPEAGFDLSQWQPDWFGAFRQVTIQSKKSTFLAYEDNHADLEEYMAGLRTRMASATSEYDKDKLKERLAKLAGGLAVVKVGGVTEAAMKERRARVEDALGALRAALKGGLVPGAGSSYMLAVQKLSIVGPVNRTEAFEAGWDAVAKALAQPLAVIATNAGKEGRHISLQVDEALTAQGAWDIEGDDPTYDGPWMGYDALTDQIRDLSEEPTILNPTLVDCKALQAAVSIASTLLTVEVSLTQRVR